MAGIFEPAFTTGLSWLVKLLVVFASTVIFGSILLEIHE
jgi:hypothetical protein